MIRGQKTNLRAIESADVENYHHWINDEETNQWRGLYHPTSKEEALKWIETERSTRSDAVAFSIQLEGKHIGFIGLRGICSRSRRAEIWIYIGDKTFWDQGIGQDATQTLCDYAFFQMNLFRIWLECNPEFTPVVQCYKKIGFIEEGRLRKAYFRNGDFHDTCIMGLLRTDWERSRKTGGSHA